MSDPILVRPSAGRDLRAICGKSSFGLPSYSTASLPDRLYVGLDEANRPPSVEHLQDELNLTTVPTPLEELRAAQTMSGRLQTETRRTLARVEALWLLMEDSYRLLDAEKIEPLAHQASLVEHIVARPHLRRVMIADEVGLGKTVEAGLIIRRVREQEQGQLLRTLYLTEAQLAENVADELEKLGLAARLWISDREEGRIRAGDTDSLVVASIHRAVGHYDRFRQSGPWHIIVVDEAHHLSDWSPEGSSPGERMKLVRMLVEERLVPNGRLLLMTGTPHQGHDARFRNVLRLLSDKNDEREARGRVIYRIKEDILDWDGKPLFPGRNVRAPTIVNVGTDYESWLTNVHRLLAPAPGSRAGGWRRAQALQWCASSPEAGLAMLIGHTLRAGIRASRNRPLRAALAAIQPYRSFEPDLPAEVLEARLLKDAHELETPESGPLEASRALLDEVLAQGTALVRGGSMETKLLPVYAWMDSDPKKKIVLFAQPVDTVYALARRLASRYGAGTAPMLVGGQSREERRAAIEDFSRNPACRVLVSSRSGGEGINLQVSNHLVHFDVPWNPMEMEQRVGRVHRYGSASTVEVDTIVLENSREMRVLDRARARLGQIVRDLDPARLSLLFQRTMALIPLEELAQLMAGENFGDLTSSDEKRLDELVQQGFREWSDGDRAFRAEMESIHLFRRGETTDKDFEDFLTRALGASSVPGWRRRSLESVEGVERTRTVENEARVVRLPDGTLGYVGRHAGIGLVGPDPKAATPRRLGLNVRNVATALRRVVGGTVDADSDAPLVSGCGSLIVERAHWSALLCSVTGPEAFENGAVLLAFVVRYLDLATRPREVKAEIAFYLTPAKAESHVRLDTKQCAALVRLMRGDRAKRSVPESLDFERLALLDRKLVDDLRAFQRGDPVPAVFPIGAVWVEPQAGIS